MPLHCFFVDINKTKKKTNFIVRGRVDQIWRPSDLDVAIWNEETGKRRLDRSETVRKWKLFFFLFLRMEFISSAVSFHVAGCCCFFFSFAFYGPSSVRHVLLSDCDRCRATEGHYFFSFFFCFCFFFWGGGLRSVLFSSSISAKAELIDWANRWMRPQTHLPAVIASSECFTGFRRSSYRVFFVAALSFVALRRRSSDWLVPMRPQSHLPDRRLPVDGAGVGDYEPFFLFYILALISDERRWASMRAPSSTINSHTSWRRGGHQSSMGYNRGHSFDSTLK